LIVLYLLALPLISAALDWGFPATLLALVSGLAALWWQRMKPLLRPPSGPEFRLDTISASHYVEKVRWCMDRLGLDYEEVPDVGALGVFTAGRTVPRLRIRTGSVISSIGNSSDILRYLWGRYGRTDPRAAFLEPGEEALVLERQLDSYGLDLQRWVYQHILPDRSLTLQLWGANDPGLPGWQRGLERALFPLLRVLMRRAFRLSPGARQRVLANIQGCLQTMEERLGDGRANLLGGEESSFVDLTLASLSGLWIVPPEYGGGRAEGVRADLAALPDGMLADRQRWLDDYPRVSALVQRLYREERVAPAPVT
jgi:glutathione S-transferase